jgi:cysteine-rich repeat protein
MKWLHLASALACAALAACSFDTGGLADQDGGGQVADARDHDAPDTDAPVADARLTDAPLPDAPLPDAPLPPPPDDAALPDAPLPPPPDAALPDAPLPPDAALPDAAVPTNCGDHILQQPPEQCDDGNLTAGDGCDGACQIEPGACPGGTEIHSLPVGTTVSGSTTGQPNHLSGGGTCGGSSSGEDVYVVTVPAKSDLTATTNLAGTSFNTVLYVRATCGGANLACASAGMLGDTATVQNLAPGIYWVVVDGFGGANGNYQLLVTLKPVLPQGATCDPTGTTDRCDTGLTCSSSGGPGSTCQPSGLVCAQSATPLSMVLGDQQMGSTSGASGYTPSCGGANSAPEDIYSADVVGTATDLVVDVTGVGNFNPLVEIDTTCGDPTTHLACVNVSTTPNKAEVAIVPNATPGTYFPVVDGAGSSSGSYTIEAYQRTLVGANATCDRDLRATRCITGVCVDGNDADTIPTCTTGVTTLMEGSNNGLACAAFDGPETGDFVYRASISGGSDIDVVKLTPAQASRLVVTVASDGGGCPIDLAATIFTTDCANPMAGPTVLFTSDDDGIGACPYIDTPAGALAANQDYWLAISRTGSAGTGNYVAVVDFIP